MPFRTSSAIEIEWILIKAIVNKINNISADTSFAHNYYMRPIPNISINFAYYYS